jgi:hypothetical protein
MVSALLEVWSVGQQVGAARLLEPCEQWVGVVEDELGQLHRRLTCAPARTHLMSPKNRQRST